MKGTPIMMIEVLNPLRLPIAYASVIRGPTREHALSLETERVPRLRILVDRTCIYHFDIAYYYLPLLPVAHSELTE